LLASSVGHCWRSYALTATPLMRGAHHRDLRIIDSPHADVLSRIRRVRADRRSHTRRLIGEPIADGRRGLASRSAFLGIETPLQGQSQDAPRRTRDVHRLAEASNEKRFVISRFGCRPQGRLVDPPSRSVSRHSLGPGPNLHETYRASLAVDKAANAATIRDQKFPSAFRKRRIAIAISLNLGDELLIQRL